MRLDNGMKAMRIKGFLIAGIILPYLVPSINRGTEMNKSEFLVYVGTYTKTKSEGIYVYRFDSRTGKLVPLGLAAKTGDPSFLAMAPHGRFLYAVNETNNFQGGNTGAVSAFSVDQKTGKLTLLNQVPSGGAGPCFVSLDKTGKFVLVANYDSGSVSVFPILPDGRLGAASAWVQHHGSGTNPQRQEGPHAHSIEVSPDNRFVLAADLGLDQLLIYRFDATRGSLEPGEPPFAKVPPGAGPRHFAFAPSGQAVYVVNEMGASVSAFAYDRAHGNLTAIETISTLPKDFSGQSDAAEIAVSPAGRFLYASNRGHDSIAVFSINAGNGHLAPVEFVPTRGKTPRHFAIDPTGSYLVVANQDSDNLVVFRIDPHSGRLNPVSEVSGVSSPVCITFLPRL